ncbi:arsenical efflux pump membrane protein ArsB [Candidatus Bathyarchaeota archaeon A05DMB-2]|jgi:arsenical pump membrane protein|nr:arsenical efflux pump membrane protein ArsB [Candidatus Bathyarchaeota archaeon A05DMB-2]
MNYTPIAALIVFGVTLFLMIKRPRNLKLGYTAAIGAVASLLLGTVTLGEAVQSFFDIWDAALAFIGIIALSVTLDALGFFKWAALKVVRLAGGSGVRLYFYVSLLTVVVSILFANDSAVLILTPIVLEIISQLKIDAKGRLAYLFSAGLIADTAAMPLITSNPINILNADFFKYSFIEHVIFMGPVAVATILSSLLLVYLFFRKRIPKIYDAARVDLLSSGSQLMPPAMLNVSVATLVAIDVGYVFASLIRVPVSLVICSGAVFLIAVYWAHLNRWVYFGEERKGLKSLAREINWDIVLFMVSIFIVVQGLREAGVVEFLASVLAQSSLLPSVLSVFVPSLVVTVGASFMNNWPMTILGLLSINQAASLASLSGQALTGLVFSNVIGNNLGPHFFPLGSLAILMWLEMMRRKGVKISLKEYLKIGALLSIVEVLIASLIIWVELNFFGFRLGL